MSAGENYEARPSLIYLDGTDDPAPRQLGPYRVIARFSGSGMTDVYLGQKKSALGFVRLVVIKHVPRRAPQYDLKRQMLFDEARALAYLDHPNLVTLLDAEEDNIGVYLCLEFVDGTDLRTVNGSLRARGEALPFELAGFIAVEVLRGLHHAHSAERPDGSSLRIVHRDVNPANILVSRTGHIKLTDFGVVHMQDRVQSPTEPGLVKGKFAYLAPEYIQGRPVDARMDTYSVGVVLFELLTGRPLFTGESAHEIMRKIVAHEIRLDRLKREGVPEVLCSIVERALAKESVHRFSTSEDMANALETWLIKSELHASPWILSAFFRQHHLFGPSARVSGPANAFGNAGLPAAGPGTPGTRPFTAHTDAAALSFDSDEESITHPEARPPQAITAPVVETVEPITSPGARIPQAATVRTGPPAFTTPTHQKSQPPSSTSQPPARVFPSFSQPPLRSPENTPTAAGTPNPLRSSGSNRPASRPPGSRSSPPDIDDFESTESTERGSSPVGSSPPVWPDSVDIPVSVSAPPPTPQRHTEPQPLAQAQHRTGQLHQHHPAHPPPMTSGHAPSAPPSRIGPGAASGTLAEAAPAVVLSRLLSSHASGTLEFRSGLIWKRIDMHDGQVMNASSNMGMEDLGEQLVRARIVKRGELDRAFRESHGSEMAAWHRLLEIGAVTREALAKQLGQSVTRALEDALSWEEGTFEFTPGSPEVPPVIPTVDLGGLVSKRLSAPPTKRPSQPPPAPARSASTPEDGLPPRKRPSLSEALGLARQAQEGSTPSRGSNPPSKD